MTLTTVPTPAPGVETAYLDGEAVLYDVVRRRPLLLNVTASAVWMLVDGQSSADQIADELAEIFGADREVVRTDVDTVLSQLADLGLLAGTAGRDEREGGESLVVGGALPAPPVP